MVGVCEKRMLRAKRVGARGLGGIAWNPVESCGIRRNPVESRGIPWNPVELGGLRVAYLTLCSRHLRTASANIEDRGWR